MSTFSVILAAAGKSTRFRDKHYRKPFAPLGNRAVWLHSAERFLNREDVKQLIVLINREDQESFSSKFSANVAILGIDVVVGGEERVDSIANAMDHVKPDVDFIAIHDAARPCIADEWISSVFAEAERSDAAILAMPVAGTLKRVGDRKLIESTVPRAGIWEAQTPQVFRRQLVLDAYANRTGPPATDDAELVERFGHDVSVVPGSPLNMKITTKQDMNFAACALKALPKPRILGSAHPFADDDMWR